jgi:hypothetical protein
MSPARYNYQMAAEALRAAGDFVQLVAVLTEAGLPIADSDREMALAGEIAGRNKSAPTTPKVDPPLDCHVPSVGVLLIRGAPWSPIIPLLLILNQILRIIIRNM